MANHNWRIHKDDPVYDETNDKIGSIDKVENGYFKLNTGLLGLGETYYVPDSAIADLRDGNVYLLTTKERLPSMGWESKPTGSTHTSTGSFKQDSDDATGTAPREGGLRSDPGREERTIPRREEQVDVEKRAVVTENKPVEETVRREVPHVEKSGNVREVDDRTSDKDLLTEEERRRRERGSL